MSPISMMMHRSAQQRPRWAPSGLGSPVLLLLALLTAGVARSQPPDKNRNDVFARDNIVAWCIVPFDSKQRGPEERAEMLQRLGLRRLAYDWRAEHVPTFDAEIEALERHDLTLEAFWVAPGVLNDMSRQILDVLRRQGVKAQLWALLDLGPDLVEGEEQARRIASAAESIRPLALEASKIGGTVALYNHGGWFGEPENQIAIVQRLQGQGFDNVGIVYNLHHGHAHLDRFAELLEKMKPHLLALNLNGMDRGGDLVGRKILPIGQGEMDLDLLRTIRDSGFDGPIGIIGHTDDDVEQRLRDNLDGLDWLLRQLDGQPAGPRPTPRTPVPPRPADDGPAGAIPFDPALVTDLLEQAKVLGDPARGAGVFAAPQFGCLTCHKIDGQGGEIGPDLSAAGACLTPEAIVEAILWPRRSVKEGYEALTLATTDGQVHQGLLQEETTDRIVLLDIASGDRLPFARAEIEEMRLDGSPMPDGLAVLMSARQRLDLIRFLTELGRSPSAAEALQRHTHLPASFAFDRAPIDPDRWPGWQEPVNRDRLYDFYAKQADHFREQTSLPPLLAPFPGLDGGRLGHWGNQEEQDWADDRWGQSERGPVLSGVFRGAGVTVPKGVCVRLGAAGELSACFNPETLRYEALWRGGFVKITSKRQGFLDGLGLVGEPLPAPEDDQGPPDGPFEYLGFYRHGERVLFAYRVNGVEMLDAPWAEEGRFTRIVAPLDEHPMAGLTRGGPSRWPQVLETRGERGQTRPYAIDTINPPFDNPWGALLFFGDHDFLPDGTAFLGTMQGDVWRVEGLDDSLQRVRWRRVASGLHQVLGLVVAEGDVYVLGRDQITRLHDLNGDGEADFYECFSNAYLTSPKGHDYLCGLQRDDLGRFFTASSAQGLLRISADGKDVEVLATGFRNPGGLGLAPDGTLTVPSSEGEWTPASMICEVRPGGDYGSKGPPKGQPPDLPLVYLPRGLDNSSGGQVHVASDRWGPLQGQMIHFSFGMGAYFLVLRDEVEGQPQGAVVPLPGAFRSGAQRGRFHPIDGQLYVSGLGGWGTYTPDDGCFQRVRYTGDPVQQPVAFRAFENGAWIRFNEPIDVSAAGRPEAHFAHAWNYRYGPGYGSPEYSPSHPGTPGHDPLAIRSAHVLEDGRALFLEIPQLQPVNQLHLRIQGAEGEALDLFATVHLLDSPFEDFPGYEPPSESKRIAAHPILADLAALSTPPEPNPWTPRIEGARSIPIEAGSNLSFSTRSLQVRAGEPIRLTLINPDVVPHNWVLVRPGTLAVVGRQADRLVAEPDAVLRQYIPRSADVLAYTDVVEPGRQAIIHFQAPDEPGRYPFLCTFPGHWMVMNGELIVQE